MPLDEIFPFPTVKRVIFEVQYPNLFFLENKIGDIQFDIMDKFPNSKLIQQRAFMIANISSDSQMDLDKLRNDSKLDSSKIWRFSSENKYNLSILQNKFDITSQYHKSYNKGETETFKEIISYVLEAFLKHVQLPKFLRVGLRYIDECPIFSKTNTFISEWYNSVFPLLRYPIEKSKEMVFRTVSKRGDFNLMYREELLHREDQYKLIMDFDGFATNIKSEDIMDVTDSLHSLIEEEFIDKIKEPLYEYMRTGEQPQ